MWNMEVSEISDNTDKTILEEQQDARANLRERYLRCLIGLSGSECTMKTVEGSEVRGVFQGMDINGQEIFVKNLSTPLGELKSALVRTVDLLNISVSNFKNEISNFIQESFTAN
ncbi:gem-associated protein 7-like [Cimex lectularius]|uniref:Gem-associated protein 7 n=1 Tax=Cimex lectularius TaxID=79782 RepID=A0A8I6RCG3_CIMLE|nr:gem-associated protein 7-like [Cimex lectularius]